MRIYPQQLSNESHPLQPCYLIFGDEPWFIEQSKHIVYQVAAQQGFQDRVSFVHETGFSWGDVHHAWYSLGLFDTRQVIHLHLDNLKIGQEGSKMLMHLFEQPHPDRVLILTGAKLTTEQTKSKWFKVLDQQGMYIPCNTPEQAHFSRWLSDRIAYHQLSLTSDAQTCLHHYFEGNLLGADQALLQLTHMRDPARIRSQDVESWLTKQTKFTVYQLADALLQGSAARVGSILKQLREEGIKFPIILWQVLQEIERLYSFKVALESGQTLAPQFKKYRIWQNRQQVYQNRLRHDSLQQLSQMLSQASELERQFKTQGQEHWTGLLHLCLHFSCSTAQLPWLELEA
tara:strand:+ start:6100 stop:7131 length:1032 start_codon:yes stop_codon:yes gene_type:complete